VGLEKEEKDTNVPSKRVQEELENGHPKERSLYFKKHTQKTKGRVGEVHASKENIKRTGMFS